MRTYADNFPRFLKGDASAVELNLTLYRIAELWDDLIDRDKPVSNDEINAALYAALVTLPRNAFYRQNFTLLNPLVESVILDWFAANELERAGDRQKLRIAYGLRFGLIGVTVMCARILGGLEWAGAVNLEFRSAADPWEEYAEKFEGK